MLVIKVNILNSMINCYDHPFVHVYIALSAHLLSHFSCIQLFAIHLGAASQTPLSMGFSRQEYWSMLPCHSGDLPNPGIEPSSLMSPVLASGFFTTSATWEPRDLSLVLYYSLG